MKQLNTLVDDVYSLFDPKETHTPQEENLDTFANNLKDILRDRLKENVPRTNPLRFSNLGKPDRQIWYQAKGVEGEAMTNKTYLKFLFGDVYEQLLLFLAKEAGHTVEQEQAEVEIGGVFGHIDAVIDGVVIDAKSASPFGYQKLKQLKLLEPDQDPFGYVAQLSGYAHVLTPGKEAAWFAVDKVGGDLCVPILNADIVAENKPEDRINHLKEVIESPEPPPRCYEDKPEGKSGNRSLATGCSYCPYKFSCWDNLRGFAYSTGPKWLTVVKDLPRVPEITS